MYLEVVICVCVCVVKKIKEKKKAIHLKRARFGGGVCGKGWREKWYNHTFLKAEECRATEGCIACMSFHPPIAHLSAHDW